MLPHQQNKIDTSSLSEEEQKLFRLYGKLPNRKDLLANKLKERKYFDSGDYALSKAGRAPKQSVGTAIPNPEMVPHAAASPGAHMGSTAQPIPGTLSPASPGAHMGLSRSPSGSRRLSTSGGSFTDSGSRSSFPVATGAVNSSPTREPTSSLSRE
ncbi:unnamed protein product [Malassezia sympodialis ATCC 42132]|uniref:mRNA stability protein n=1 Tax=Malassezia sympodialis (strain ATCC 42132) TaxID=1230383 RepID=M5EIH1_MALS4|nr:uncharacterized protein MSY001_0113 [Malassezia sympodialis ATCC 42132]CCU97407.1 unnamed protein product [Malassezia sympodialis ATCC 42132]SHO77220.1 Similar to S.cerevisiae protein IGO2 (Protein required for initiation of G0 program) [Malassezia sympodialis ATCC 42132]|eukprot:XP_018738758.1 uncharacterized protein MSY001_0113 [Malassezia sympodialis ATCC 42132]